MTDKTQPRDWSEVIDKLWHSALYPQDSFREKALAILQEFDAQNQAGAQRNCCDGCQYELDELIKEVAKTINWSGSWTGLYLYIKKNYPQQCEKYMARETKNPNVSESMSDEIDEIINAPTEAPLELVIGDYYEMIDGSVRKLIASHDSEYVVLEEEIGFEIFEKREFIRKHTPAPKQHEVDFWVNVDKDGFKNTYETKKDSDTWASRDRIACLNIKRSFLEGEGL